MAQCGNYTAVVRVCCGALTPCYGSIGIAYFNLQAGLGRCLSTQVGINTLTVNQRTAVELEFGITHGIGRLQYQRTLQVGGTAKIVVVHGHIQRSSTADVQHTLITQLNITGFIGG